MFCLFDDPSGVTFPNHLETLTFGDNFNRSLEGVALEAVFRGGLNRLKFDSHGR